MLKKLKGKWKSTFFQLQAFFIAKLIKLFLHLLIKTCRIEIEGIDQFLELAAKKKCILMLWHNRLAPISYLLSIYTPHIDYTAIVSGSRDGNILSYIIHSYQNGNTIRVPHLARYKALRTIINHIKEENRIVVITPDGPRGPCYELKPGIVIAALETHAHIISVNWEAEKYWELKTWDKFRIPKPFTTLHVNFHAMVCFDKMPQPSLEEAISILKEKISSTNMSLYA